MTYLYPFILLPSFPCGLSRSSGIYFLDMFIESNPIPLSFIWEVKQTKLSQASLVRQASHSPHHPALLHCELIDLTLDSSIVLVTLNEISLMPHTTLLILACLR